MFRSQEMQRMALSLMMYKISRSYAPISIVDYQTEKEKKTIEGDWGGTGRGPSHG